MCKIWRTVISLSRRQISLLPSVIGIILILYSYMTADISKKTILVRTQPMFSGKTTQKYKEPSPASMTNLNVSLIEQRFSERRNLLLRQCKERLKWNDHILEYSSLEITKMYSVLEGYKVLFCHVLKSGFSSICNLLAHLYNHEEMLESGLTYKIVDILRSSRQLFKEAMNSEQFLRFFVAREPLARLLSGYLNRIKYTDDRSYQRQHWGPLILGYTRGLRQRDVAYPNKTLYIIPTFEEFARYLVSQNPRNFDPHWLPIGFQCGVCEYNYTHIVHLETFVEDMEYIISVTGIDKGVDMAKISLRQNVGIGNTRKVLKKYYSTLDAKTLQKIVDIYKDDFKLFGYDPSQMLKEISPNVTIKF
ncbi:carbohydrate sulfotransferase 14-like isoform X1 [Palaemon carinicauda]|uniref:carbohydrate sulfotransferase 14-like isoform X1 n=1 Tax=Palaemon carinicauda TaxID=392227 RepID=UPI0035B69BB6